MTPAILVRPMTVADLDAVLQLEAETPSAPHWSRAEYEASLHAGDGLLRRTALVAEGKSSAGRILGFAVARHLVFHGAEGRGGGESELESIVVRPEARRRGVGRLLMEAIIAEARALGSGRFDLEVRASNVAAQQLYAAAGLRIIGSRPRYYADPEDALLMELDLRPQQ